MLLQQKVSLELKLLAILSRPTLTDGQVKNALTLFQFIDFKFFRALLDQHRVWPCVYCNIRKHFPDLLPQALFNYLKKKHQQNMRQSQRQFDICGKLLCRFKELDVPVKVLKGIPLAFKLYGDISKRHSKDLDLVIKKENLNLAHDILTFFNFKCSDYEKITQEYKQYYFDTRKDITYCDDKGTIIELHIRLSPYPIKLTSYYSSSLFNHNSLNKNNPIEFVYLCWHGTYTLFHRLKWLVDIALYIEQYYSQDSQDSQDTDKLIDLANKFGAMRILTVPWILANILYDIEIPARVLFFYKQDMTSRLITSQCLKTLNNPKNVSTICEVLETVFYNALLLKNWSEKGRGLWIKFTPIVNDREILAIIPAKLSFMYYLLRPFTVFYRRLLNK